MPDAEFVWYDLPVEEAIVYTDGACSGNPGPGGWGAIVCRPDGRVREFGGGERPTTNNRMEITAALLALQSLADFPGPVRVYTDSSYLIQGVTSWIGAWRRKGWRTMEGKPVLNRDLWERIHAVIAARAQQVSWRWVRGHTGSAGNERCDEIAVAYSRGKPPELYEGPLLGYEVEISALPAEVELPKGSHGRPSAKKAGFYLSLLDGRLERHSNWADCQARVHGKNARFKKVSSAEEEAATLKAWGL